VQHRERGVGLALVPGDGQRVEERLGQHRRAAEELDARLRRRGREQRLEQLADDAESELAFELAPAGREDA